MILTALSFFIILSILILIHELGHYTVARLSGIKVEEFGLGLPPRIGGITIGGTLYSVNWLPIGGFVRLAGEDEDIPEYHGSVPAKYAHHFWAQSALTRSAVLLAGVAMNFVLAVGITTYILSTHGLLEPGDTVHNEQVAEESPALDAGLREGDVVRAITYTQDGKELTRSLTTTDALIGLTQEHRGEEVTLSIERDGQIQSVSLVPRADPPEGQGSIGIAITTLTRVIRPFPQSIVEATRISIEMMGQMFASLGRMTVRLVRMQPQEAEVAGPIGIAQATGRVVQFGFLAILEFMSILSLNLAVLNLLPIPALDGGRFLFVIIEKIIGRRIAPAFERTAHQYGMLFLFAILFLVSINDILRIAKGLL